MRGKVDWFHNFWITMVFVWNYRKLNSIRIRFKIRLSGLHQSDYCLFDHINITFHRPCSINHELYINSFNFIMGFLTSETVITIIQWISVPRFFRTVFLLFFSASITIIITKGYFKSLLGFYGIFPAQVIPKAFA